MRMLTERKSVSLAAGAYSFNTQRFNGQVMQHVFVNALSTNTYDFSITNADGDVVFSRTVTGDINEVDVGLPLLSIMTVAIANATVAADPVVIYLVGNNGSDIS